MEINTILISPDPEELWLGAHFMNDHNFNTVTVGRKRGCQVSNNAYFEGILVQAKRQLDREMRSQWIIIKNELVQETKTPAWQFVGSKMFQL